MSSSSRGTSSTRIGCGDDVGDDVSILNGLLQVGVGIDGGGLRCEGGDLDALSVFKLC